VIDAMDSDIDFFGLRHLDGTGLFAFEVSPVLSRLDGRLYGGTAIGVSIAVAELATDRPAVWMTTQFVSTVATGAIVAVGVEILAPGKRTNQVRITGTGPDGSLVFASLGATGRHPDDAVVAAFDSRPTVSSPADSESWTSPFAGMRELFAADDGTLPERPSTGQFDRLLEMRGAHVSDHPDPGPGRVCVWARRRDGGPVTAAIAAYIADMVPMSISRGLGKLALGSSLDNTIRIGAFRPTEWVLLDLRPHLAAGNYGHGTVHVWDTDGHLLGTASQTTSFRTVDPADLPFRR
jgi:acyl-CoA thioesterase II